MEFKDNVLAIVDEIQGVNLVENDDEYFLSFEFSEEPEVQLHFTTEDLIYLRDRLNEIIPNEEGKMQE